MYIQENVRLGALRVTMSYPDPQDLQPSLVRRTGRMFEDQYILYMRFVRDRLRLSSYYDIGGCFGNHVVGLGAGSAMAITCFEPNAALHAVIRENARRNNVVVDVDPCALGAAPGQGTLAVADAANMGANHVIASDSGDFQIATLDEVVHRHRPPDLIKIDTEGFELAVLQGGEHVLADHAPEVFVEVTRVTLDDVMQLLKRHGYAPIHRMGKNWHFSRRIGATAPLYKTVGLYRRLAAKAIASGAKAR